MSSKPATGQPKTRYKHIVFRMDSMNPVDWVCMNRRDYDGRADGLPIYLGRCVWYPAWRCWVFEASGQAVWSKDCLVDVADFLGQLDSMGRPESAVDAPQE